MLLCIMLLISACGGTANTGSVSKNANSDKSAGSGTTGSATNANSSSGGNEASLQTRTIKHNLGEAVIEGTPQRVIALEWSIAEDLLALGVQPVGIADIENMKKWVALPVEIGSDVVDVGLRTAPDMELLASLEPDLIIGLDRNLESNYETMSGIAPTIAFNPYPLEGEGNHYDAMIQSFNEIADILGKKDEAEAVLKQLDDTYAEAKAKLAAAGMSEAPFVLAMGYSNQDAVVYRLSTDNALAVKVLENIGLKNAHKPQAFEVYGFTTSDVEALPAIQDANFLHIVQDDDNVIDNQMKNNAVWNSLNFVKENRVFALGGDMWPYGGPLSAQIMAQKTADLLTQ
ncbi:iron-siderophore ABC transporter substrate-binding protein [Paenibacillaceae bacterium]|nr:iron-siderophore ABC transporter substrate-binding protein [Paenibacillaceae bacterium]